MASKHSYLKLKDLRGGMNNTDEPQSVPEDQCVDARNIDWDLGTLGGKRAGCEALTIDNSVFNNVVPNLFGHQTQAAAGVASVTFNVPATTDDSTGATYHWVIVKVNTKPNTAITGITLNGVALTSVGANAVGTSGRLDVWRLAAAALANGSMVITWAAGITDAAIIVERWQKVNGLVFSGATSGTSQYPQVDAAVDPRYVMTDALVIATGATVTANQVVAGTNIELLYSAGTGRISACYTIGRDALVATNFGWRLSASVDWVYFTLNLLGAPKSAYSSFGYVFLALVRHQPTNNLTEDELWGVDVSGRMDRRVGGTWQTGVPGLNYVGMFDATGFDINGASLHGKLFLACNGGLAGLMVWDGTVLRYAGFPYVPGPPTGANTGAGTFSGTRYYRMRFVEINSAGVVVRRSEPTTALTFAPSGAGTGVIVTKPVSPDPFWPTTESNGNYYYNGQTHWELEASLDNTLFYRIATTGVATTTVTDSTAVTTTYTAFPLSDPIGQNVAPPGARHAVVDEDRLVLAGNRHNASQDSRIWWTPVGNATGVGNDERVPTTTANNLDLDNLNGGNIQMLIAGESGNIYAFKWERIHKLTRTGILTAAYAPQTESKSRGSTKRGAISGHDQFGTPCVYFTDPYVGLCRVSKNGIEQLSDDVLNTWETVFLGGPSTGHGPRLLYWPGKHQVWVAYGPTGFGATKILVFNTRFGDAQGKGYALYESDFMTAGIFVPMMFPDTATTFLPYMGGLNPGLVKFTLTATNDAGAYYRAYWLSRVYQLGQGFAKFGIMAGVVFAQARAATTIGIALVKNLGLGRLDTTQSIAPAFSETHVWKPNENAKISECFGVQFELGDPASYTGAQLDQTWVLDEYTAKVRSEDEGTS